MTCGVTAVRLREVRRQIGILGDTGRDIERSRTENCEEQLPSFMLMENSLTAVHEVDPLRDHRWQALIDRHPNASVFQTTGWLEALRLTYGYQPVVFTTSPPSTELTNGLLFCCVKSWLTARRMVSLPFSDYCEPLSDSVEEVELIVRYLQSVLDHHGWRYLEIRPVKESFRRVGETAGFRTKERYFLHRIDLRPNLDDLFRSFDKDSIQQRVRRAERSGLVEKCGRSEELLKDFYSLLVLTRRRHCLPPQPYAWFQNLIRCLGDEVKIHSVYKEGSPTASILTLRFRDTAYYKYGASNAKFNNLGGIPFLLWNAIAEAKSTGATVFDLGRTEVQNRGLLAFKNKWVPDLQSIVYWKYPGSSTEMARLDREINMVKQIFSYMPNRLLKLAGRIIYPHIG